MSMIKVFLEECERENRMFCTVMVDGAERTLLAVDEIPEDGQTDDDFSDSILNLLAEINLQAEECGIDPAGLEYTWEGGEV